LAVNSHPVLTASQPHYTIPYRVLSQYLPTQERRVEVHATPQEIQQLVNQGYLVREALLTAEGLAALRQALDALEAQERQGKSVTGRGFGGLFLRHLGDKHPLFREMVKFAPTLSIARAMLGPLVQIRGFSARISYPNEPSQEVQWHIHQQVISDPLPPFFVHPHGLDCLLYLDDLNDANGPLCFLPGSHWNTRYHTASEDFEDKPGQVIVRAPAGSCVIIHSNLWHRALPTTPAGTKRRLIIMTYTPTWMKQAPYGVRPTDGLTQALLQSGDEEVRELLGVGGYT
jgi:ectoine hydroxylase-related dioxygenase (phytanoyl-CoA dioxygenase family)